MTLEEKKELVQITINGRDVLVPRMRRDPVSGREVRTTIMEACELAGVHIPHFCYHPALPVSGTCRMCLVECSLPLLGPDQQPLRDQEGRIMRGQDRQLVTACSTPITPFVEVWTDTDTVKRMRAEVLQSLLANHPLDCPICDKAGECVLQEYTYQYSPSESSSEGVKGHKTKAQLVGQNVLYYPQRCILCTRCIRFLHYILGDDSAGIVRDGACSIVALSSDKELSKNYMVNIVDLCPVGALTSTDFRLKMKVWFLKQTKTVCAGCGRGCNILAASREGRIFRITPRRHDGINAYWMCDFGRFTHKPLQSPTRIVRPFSRFTGSSRLAEVVDDLALRLKVSRGRVAIIASASLSCEELFVVKKLADVLFGWTDCVPHFGEPDDFLVVEDRNANTNGARITGVCFTEIGFQLGYIAQAIERGQIDVLISIGEDLTSHEFFGEELLRRVPVIAVSSFELSPMTQLAHIVLPACSHFEKKGSFINEAGWLQRFERVVCPPEGTVPELTWLCELLSRVGGPTIDNDPARVFQQMAREIREIPVSDWHEIGDQGILLQGIA